MSAVICYENHYTWYYLRRPKFTRRPSSTAIQMVPHTLSIVWCKTDNVQLNKAPNQITMNHILMFNYGYYTTLFQIYSGIKSIGWVSVFASYQIDAKRKAYTLHTQTQTYTTLSRFDAIFLLCVRSIFGVFRFCLIKCAELSIRVFSVLSFGTLVQCCCYISLFTDRTRLQAKTDNSREKKIE